MNEKIKRWLMPVAAIAVAGVVAVLFLLQSGESRTDPDLERIRNDIRLTEMDLMDARDDELLPPLLLTLREVQARVERCGGSMQSVSEAPRALIGPEFTGFSTPGESWQVVLKGASAVRALACATALTDNVPVIAEAFAIGEQGEAQVLIKIFGRR